MNRQLKRNFPLAIASLLILFFILSYERQRFNEELGDKIAAEISRLRVISSDQAPSKTCDSTKVITSTKLDVRHPWSDDPNCSSYEISHMIPHCRHPVALASYPGSGNTWMRHLIEGSTGIFTGSRYKDLEIQMYGLWGEIRDWSDGTTIVQKTHDANKYHVQKDFGGRAILILRNPYSALLSNHNFLFSGHRGRAPSKNYERKNWPRFVAIQVSKWLDMATNWTVHSDQQKVLVLHYERVRTDSAREMRKVLRFLGFAEDEARLACLERHKNGFFRRRQEPEAEVVPFNADIRATMDLIIDRVDQLLGQRGFETMPKEDYDFYHKTDEQILDAIRAGNKARSKVPEVAESAGAKVDKSHGTRMVLEQYFKWLDMDQDKVPKTGETVQDDMKTLLLRQIFKSIRDNSNTKTITGLSAKAEGFLTKAVEIWPIVQKPFMRDPIDDVIQSEGFRAEKIEDVLDSLDKMVQS